MVANSWQPIETAPKGDLWENEVNDGEKGFKSMNDQMLTNSGRRSAWIRTDDRLPPLGDQVWVRFSDRKGESSENNPVLGGWFDGDKFVLGGHTMILYTIADCLEAGLTHWQPRRGGPLPSPQIDPADIVPRPRRKMKLSPTERKRRSQRMRDYWANKRQEAAEATATDE